METLINIHNRKSEIQIQIHKSIYLIFQGYFEADNKADNVKEIISDK